MSTFIEGPGKLVKLAEAPPKLEPGQRLSIIATMPDGNTVAMFYDEAEKFHKALGQELAKGLRVR